jgi:hypothetical protein
MIITGKRIENDVDRKSLVGKCGIIPVFIWKNWEKP